MLKHHHFLTHKAETHNPHQLNKLNTECDEHSPHCWDGCGLSHQNVYGEYHERDYEKTHQHAYGDTQMHAYGAPTIMHMSISCAWS